MPSKRSEILEPPRDARPADGRDAAAAQRRQYASQVHPWWETFKSNAPLPVLILLLFPLVWILEGRGPDASFLREGVIGPYYQRIVMLIGFNIILAVSLQLINGFSGQFSLGHAGFMAVGAYLAAYPARTFARGLSDPVSPLLFFLALGVVVTLVGLMLLGIFLAVRASGRVHRYLPGALLLGLSVWLLADFANAADRDPVPPWLVWTYSVQKAQQLFLWFIAAGEPAAQRVAALLPESARQPLCFLVLVIGGGACASAVGLIVGMPALRLRGDYLAIATLGFAEIIRVVIQNAQPLGGALGLTGIPKYTDFLWLYGFAIVTVAVIWRVAYSAKGRAIMAVREDEIAAAAVGIDTTHHKVMAFVIGAFFGGVAGALFALHEFSITPSYFSIVKSIEVVVMVTLGGLGSISGAILAAVVLTVLLELLRAPPSLAWGWVVVIVIAAGLVAVLRRRGIWPAVTLIAFAALWELGVLLARQYRVNLADFRMIIYSLALILMMLLRPQGLLGGRELWPKRRGPRVEATPTEDRDDRDPVAITGA